MKTLIVMLAVLSITACSSQGVKKDTRQVNEVACSGFELWPDCDTKAKRVCANGYDVIKRDESQVQQRRVMTFYCN